MRKCEFRLVGIQTDDVLCLASVLFIEYFTLNQKSESQMRFALIIPAESGKGQQQSVSIIAIVLLIEAIARSKQTDDHSTSSTIT